MPRVAAPAGAQRSARGVGLGLAIVERTMQVHGGRLELTNPATGGACAEMIFTALAPGHGA